MRNSPVPYPPWIDQVLRGDPESDQELEAFLAGGRRLQAILKKRIDEADEELQYRRQRRNLFKGRTILDALSMESDDPRAPAPSIPAAPHPPTLHVPKEESTLWKILRVLYENPQGMALAELGRLLVALGAYQSEISNPTRSTATNLDSLRKMGWRFSKPRYGVWALESWPHHVPRPKPWPEARAK